MEAACVQALGAMPALRQPPRLQRFATLEPAAVSAPRASATAAAATPAGPARVPSPAGREAAPRRTSSRLRSAAVTSAYAARSIAAAKQDTRAASGTLSTPSQLMGAQRSATALKTPRLERETSSTSEAGPSHSGTGSRATAPQPVHAPRQAPFEAQSGQLAERSTAQCPAQDVPALSERGSSDLQMGGWGAVCVATPCGVSQAMRQLTMVAGYYKTPLAAAAQAGAHLSQQDSVLPAALLAQCHAQLQAVRSSLLTCVVCSAIDGHPPR